MYIFPLTIKLFNKSLLLYQGKVQSSIFTVYRGYKEYWKQFIDK